MSFYKNPRDVPGLQTDQGTPLPPSVLKVQQRRGVPDAAVERDTASPSNNQKRSAADTSASAKRDDGLKRRGGSEKPAESSNRHHAPNIHGSVLLGVVEPPVQSAPSSSSPQLETMRSSDSSSSKPFTSARAGSPMASGGQSRFSFRRKGASDLHADDLSRASTRMSLFMLGFWILWAAAFISLTYIFVLQYYLNYVSSERDQVGFSLAVSASVVAASYFTPLYQAIELFNSSMNSGLLVSANSFAGMSSIAYPIMKTVPYIVEISVYFDTSSTSMRFRPSVGGMRIEACDNAYPPATLGYQLTNTLADTPTILVLPDANCNNTINYCRYNLMCEPDVGAQVSSISQWISSLPEAAGSIATIAPQLYVSSDMILADEQTVTAVSLIANAMYPMRVVGDLAVLGQMIKSFSSSKGLIFIIDVSGSILAVSKDDLINPFSLATNSSTPDTDSVPEEEEEFSTTSFITSASIYSLDPMTFPWVSLLPDMRSISTPWSTSSLSTGWRIDIVQVSDLNTFALVVTERSQFTTNFMYTLYVSVLALGGIPIVALIGYFVYYAIRKIFKIQSNYRESSTNI
jgi:hypothetical protein